jgi:hypothetical protein
MATRKRTRAEKCAMKRGRNAERRAFAERYPGVPARFWRHRWPLPTSEEVRQLIG